MHLTSLDDKQEKAWRHPLEVQSVRLSVVDRHEGPRQAESIMGGMKSIVPSEYSEQAAVIQWWSSYCRTKGLDERLLAAVPNGSVLAGDSRARAIQMSRLKATGLRVGYPDLILDLPIWRERAGAVSWVTLFCGMRIEMKKKGAPKPSEEQRSYHTLLRNQGYNVIVAIGADEAIRAIKTYVDSAVPMTAKFPLNAATDAIEALTAKAGG